MLVSLNTLRTFKYESYFPITHAFTCAYFMRSSVMNLRPSINQSIMFPLLRYRILLYESEQAVFNHHISPVRVGQYLIVLEILVLRHTVS